MSKDKAELFAHYWRILAPIVAPQPEREYNFDSELKRKHRFDFAFIPQMVAVEVDGGQWKPRGGRHAGELDKEKRNIAAMLGWRILYYTPEMIERDPQLVVKQVLTAIGYK